MERTLITELSTKLNKEVKIQGWLYNFRLLGKIGFLIIQDRHGRAQVVIDDEAELKNLKHLQVGSILEVIAIVNSSSKTETGVELISPKVKIINGVSATWPLEINKSELTASLEVILENRALSLRHQKQKAIFEVQAVMAQAYRAHMISKDVQEYFGPVILASSSEGGSEIFKVNYFGQEAILAQSNQLYKQMLIGVYERVFAMSKCFRAENSNTRRHLTEVVQYEFEMGFINDFYDVIDMCEGAVRAMIKAISLNCQIQLSLLGTNLVQIPDSQIPRITFAEAMEIITNKTGEDTKNWDDLTTESEKVLCDYARLKYSSDFIFITNYPKGKFYTYKDDTGIYHNFDLLCREAEIVSGGRRVDNYDVLVNSIKTNNLNPDDFKEYLSAFKFGMPPHGGFGMGFERFTTLALGLENIREATLFPSDTKRVASQHLQALTIIGAESIKKTIKGLFVEHDLEFQVLKHIPTPTSEEAAKVRNLNINSGVKALILRDKKTGNNILVNIPAGAKLDIKKLQTKYNKTSPGKLEFEKPAVISEKYGLTVGGIPPFGEIFGIKTYIDNNVFSETNLAFNNADLEESIICPNHSLQKILTGINGDFTS